MDWLEPAEVRDFESKQTRTGYMTKTSHHRKWNSGTRRRVAGAALALTIMLVPVVAASHAAQAQTYSVLYGFTGPGGTFPYAGLIFDAKGNLYGTTYAGGASDNGVVFKLSSKGEETVLYSFTGGADGSGPYAGLIFDAKGTFMAPPGPAALPVPE